MRSSAERSCSLCLQRPFYTCLQDRHLHRCNFPAPIAHFCLRLYNHLSQLVADSVMVRVCCALRESGIEFFPHCCDPPLLGSSSFFFLSSDLSCCCVAPLGFVCVCMGAIVCWESLLLSAAADPFDWTFNLYVHVYACYLPDLWQVCLSAARAGCSAG